MSNGIWKFYLKKGNQQPVLGYNLQMAESVPNILGFYSINQLSDTLKVGARLINGCLHAWHINTGISIGQLPMTSYFQPHAVIRCFFIMVYTSNITLQLGYDVNVERERDC